MRYKGFWSNTWREGPSMLVKREDPVVVVPDGKIYVAGLWKGLKGVKGVPKFPRYIARLADYGGKMAVFWERVLASTGFKDKMILCAVIALEKRNDEEMWGKVEWYDTVLTVTKACRVDFALATTV